jgi:cytochrome c-type biogenesis protein CcmH
MRRSLIGLMVIVVGVLFAMSGVPGMADAQGTPTPRPVTDNDVNRVARNLYCPVCQNVPLEVCETQACVRWREQIRDLLSQGYTDEQVRQYFIERFGAKTVGAPTDTISQLLTIALPFALIGLVGVVVVFNLVRWRRSRRTEGENVQPESTNGGQAPPGDYRARLEAEIRKRD